MHPPREDAAPARPPPSDRPPTGWAGAARSTATAAARAALLFGVWIVIDQSAAPADLAVGVVATIGATWLSLRLLPPATGRVRVLALAARLPRFLWDSLAAGLDVARRAFDPSLPLAPGFVVHRTRLPRGSARNAFELISGLLPGTVPTAEDEHTIEYHCLDREAPVADQLAEQERTYGAALVPGRRHG